MPDPQTHGTIGALIAATATAAGVPPIALAWAAFGAICARTVQPRVTTGGEIANALGWAAISTGIGTAGAFYGVMLVQHFFIPEIKASDMDSFYPLPALVLAFFGHVYLPRIAVWIRDWKSGERP